MNENRVFKNNRLVAVEYRDDDGNLMTKYDLVEAKTTNYTVRNEDGEVTPEVTEMSDETVAHFALLDTIDARLARIEAFLWPAPPDPVEGDRTVPSWDDLEGGVAPPGTVIEDVDGKVYRNISGGTLSLPPSNFPGQADRWKHLWKPVKRKKRGRGKEEVAS